ncbi:MAG: alpha-hydroxy-acid oxidizing protein [Alphaproteobacteria bacterium]|nr:alpha-hydroxy-acid oxidizing protein [Alphaproteobacteria bacterium]
MGSATSKSVISTDDAYLHARRRLPKIIFDFIEGAAGREQATERNQKRFDNIILQPRVMGDVAQRSLETSFLGRSYSVPFGIAPMGMCNLAWPHADKHLARVAQQAGMPVCLSTAGSSTIEDMYGWGGENTWFQLYVTQSTDMALELVERARIAGYDTLILTVDVPEVSRRIRDLRNGFKAPFHIGPKQAFDFATHPRWSLSTMLAGAPSPRNFETDGKQTKFDRNASRAGADWAFLDRLRKIWKGRLIIKGITEPSDAVRVKEAGADAIYVSNHGGRQLDSAPATIDILPLIRAAVGPDYPLIFDSGVRNGDDIIKALAYGADFVMLGRPFMFALGADAEKGVRSLVRVLADEISVSMAQIGVNNIASLTNDVVVKTEQ